MLVPKLPKLNRHRNKSGLQYSVIFLRHFVVGENNGGRLSFQAKRAQQVSCLSIIIVNIVLCSEIYATAPESLANLE